MPFSVNVRGNKQDTVLEIIQFDLFRMSEALKYLSAFIRDCNSHTGASMMKNDPI